MSEADLEGVIAANNAEASRRDRELMEIIERLLRYLDSQGQTNLCIDVWRLKKELLPL